MAGFCVPFIGVAYWYYFAVWEPGGKDLGWIGWSRSRRMVCRGIFLSGGQCRSPSIRRTIIDITLCTFTGPCDPYGVLSTFITSQCPPPQARTTRCVNCQTLGWIMATKKGFRLVTIQEVRYSLFPSSHVSNPD